MSDSPEIFIAPCSREHKTETFEHFQDTVLNGIEIEPYPEMKKAGFDSRVSIWGVVSGNATHWEQLESGDIILFYTKSGVYTHLAEVVETQRNEDIGKRLWTTYDGNRLVRDLEEPWPFLIYLNNVQRIDMPAEDLHSALDYSMEYPQGFMRPTDARQKSLLKKHGSVEKFLEQYTREPLSGTIPSIEETIANLNKKTKQEPVLTANRNRTATQRSIRTSAFRRRVREIYDSSCAVCGAGRKSPHGSPEIEAVHIYPRDRNGSNDIRNGLALCKLHQWAFNVGWFSLQDNLDVLARDAPAKRGHEEFSRLDGQRIRLPQQNRSEPHPKFLEAHRAIHGF